MKKQGYRIVLTADRTLMADYDLLFDGMLASSQTSTSPPALLSGLLMPRGSNGSVRAGVAPLGLRRIEAALLQNGFTPDDVIVVDERRLRKAIGRATKVVALTSGEPAGGGMNSTTMTGVAGGRIWPEVMFRRLLKKVQRCISAKAPDAKVVVGGPGAWQLAALPERMPEIGVDHAVTGYAEGNASAVFRALADGDDLPPVIKGQAVSAEDIPCVRGASTMGVIEISRGCGLGCAFCTIGQVPMLHLPQSKIVADASAVVAAGRTSIAALSEDFFRYGGKGLDADPAAVISLLSALRGIGDLRLIQIDHACVSSIAQFTDEELRRVNRLLVGETDCQYPWVNVGVETASAELLKANGGSAKMRRADSEWSSFAAEQLRRLCRVGFLPMVSLIIGLPGEQEADVEATLEWVESFRGERITIFPVLYAPIDGSPGPTRADLTRLHWKMLRTAYRLNFKWIPKMYWDNQAAAGVSLAKRLVLQALGLGQIVQWNALFALHSRRARR